MVNAGMVRCARCGEQIEPGTPWDLAHVDGTERKVYSGPEHENGRCKFDGWGAAVPRSA